MRFADIIGHKEIIQQLAASVNSGRISHAQLFLGTEGSGNLAVARAYIQYILCQDKKDLDSCGECSSCRKVSNLAHPDVHFAFPIIKEKSGSDSYSDDFMNEFRAHILENPYTSPTEWYETLKDGNKNTYIYSSQCDEIIRKLALKSYESPMKFMVIWLPEKLYHGIGNKLLKIIEEPPSKTVFLLVSHDDDALLQTIKSRTQLVKLKKIRDIDMLEALVEKWNLPLEKARNIVNIADGNFNSAIRQAELEGGLHDDHFKRFTLWMRNCFRPDYHLLIKDSEDFHGLVREQQKAFLEYCLFVVRESIAYNLEPSLLRVTEKEKSFLQKFAPYVHDHTSQRFTDKLEESIYHVDRNANAKILFMDLSLQMHHLLKHKIQ